MALKLSTSQKKGLSIHSGWSCASDAHSSMGRSAANVLARRVARSGIQSQRAFSKTAVSEQAAGTGLGRPDAQV